MITQNVKWYDWLMLWVILVAVLFVLSKPLWAGDGINYLAICDIQIIYATSKSCASENPLELRKLYEADEGQQVTSAHLYRHSDGVLRGYAESLLQGSTCEEAKAVWVIDKGFDEDDLPKYCSVVSIEQVNENLSVWFPTGAVQENMAGELDEILQPKISDRVLWKTIYKLKGGK